MAMDEHEHEYDDNDFDAIIADIHHVKNVRDAQRMAALAERCQQRNLLLDTIDEDKERLMRSVSHILKISSDLVGLCKNPDNPYKLDSDPYMIE